MIDFLGLILILLIIAAIALTRKRPSKTTALESRVDPDIQERLDARLKESQAVLESVREARRKAGIIDEPKHTDDCDSECRFDVECNDDEKGFREYFDPDYKYAPRIKSKLDERTARNFRGIGKFSR